MSNYLNYIEKIWGNWTGLVDGMIHPDAANDPMCAPLHRSFLLGCFFSGATALFVLPLHLALAGAPHTAVVFMFAWMLSQWPLALYLSRSGNLDRSLAVSAALFALFTASICALTGGTGSFAIIWLVIPCIEAAFASRRNTALAVTLLSGGLYLALSMLPADALAEMTVPGGVELVVTLGAFLYAGLLGYRLICDRRRMKALHKAAATDFQTLNQALSGVVCEIRTTGELRLLGGPARRLFGAAVANGGHDWIFSRLHVTDRPLYLTRLSEARHEGLASKLDVKMRIWPEEGEDPNSVHFAPMTVRLAPLAFSEGIVCDRTEGQSVVIALDPVTGAEPADQEHTAEIERISCEDEPQPAAVAWQQETLMKSA